MHEPPLLLVVDDTADDRAILVARQESRGFATAEAADGAAALEAVHRLRPGLVLLDVTMPGLDGLEVTRRLKGDRDLPFTPILRVAARTAVQDVVAGLEARVEAQLRELERARLLRRFLSPEVADLVLREDGEALLDRHRREVTVAFCDLRGFIAFAETSAPEDVMAVLDAYHAALGEVLFEHRGTLEWFLGDGVVVVFDAPLPCPDHPAHAVAMAYAARERLSALGARWRRQEHVIGFGMGLAQGHATLGRIGFEGRRDDAVIGPVPSLAARPCKAAADGEILLSQRPLASFEGRIRTAPPATLALEDVTRPATAAALLGGRGEGDGALVTGRSGSA